MQYPVTPTSWFWYKGIKLERDTNLKCNLLFEDYSPIILENEEESLILEDCDVNEE